MLILKPSEDVPRFHRSEKKGGGTSPWEERARARGGGKSGIVCAVSTISAVWSGGVVVSALRFCPRDEGSSPTGGNFFFVFCVGISIEVRYYKVSDRGIRNEDFSPCGRYVVAVTDDSYIIRMDRVKKDVSVDKLTEYLGVMGITK
ncbi:hypothetical protein B9Z55_012332 [Caenorhabditis nigoni]|uniref:Uncharacterized protein n=1 Tax=Caenorhabditis nigoni TaxID=1611254 RepID=A0A2G5TXS2_9PELO|nr:hypothetical protein B9Z55_012332 [Caenorhabditis nigoni]